MSPGTEARAADWLIAFLEAILERGLAAQRRLEEMRLAALAKARENQAKVQ